MVGCMSLLAFIVCMSCQKVCQLFVTLSYWKINMLLEIIHLVWMKYTCMTSVCCLEKKNMEIKSMYHLFENLLNLVNLNRTDCIDMNSQQKQKVSSTIINLSSMKMLLLCGGLFV